MPVRKRFWKCSGSLPLAIHVAALLAFVSVQCLAKEKFTIGDDIETSRFVYPWGQGQPVFSPDGKHFMVVTERGLLKQNLPENTIWVWNTDAVRRYTLHPETDEVPEAIPLVRMATFSKDAPIIPEQIQIQKPRWLDDSKGVAFIALNKDGHAQLHVADLESRSVTTLTPEDQDVTDFAFRRNSIVYNVITPSDAEAAEAAKAETEQSPYFLVNGHSLFEMLFPADVDSFFSSKIRPGRELWAILDGKRFRVEDALTHMPIRQADSLELSPDGHSLIARVPVTFIPKAWEEYRDPPGGGAPYGGSIRTGDQNLTQNTTSAFLYVKSYFLINLLSGAVRPLVDAPTRTAQWRVGDPGVRWSPDGSSVLLPNTFLPIAGVEPSERERRTSRPCVTAVNISTSDAECVLPLRGMLEKDYFGISDIHFDSPTGDRLTIDFDYGVYKQRVLGISHGPSSVTYVRTDSKQWKVVAEAATKADDRTISVDIRQSLNEPPVLRATDISSHTSRDFWNSNPQLKQVNLGEASIVRWKDGTGYEWEAGLVKPPDYVPGKRYPLVIQTHGFLDWQFLTNGLYTTAFSARPLAAAGIMVLQMPRRSELEYTAKMMSGHVLGYESAVRMLSDKGLIDSSKVGIVGFSITFADVMAALSSNKFPIAAASATDGTNLGYWQWLATVDWFNNGHVNGFIADIGMPPFGVGLGTWMKKSPEFNLDKIKTPLLIAALGRASLFYDWEAYAGLRYLRKPVELIDLGEGSHVLNNPHQILASQGTNVDWFRFWLQGYEDSDPAKAEQYRRWEKLCDMQVAGNPGHPTFCVGTTH